VLLRRRALRGGTRRVRARCTDVAGCHNNGTDGYAIGYPKMGMALQRSGRDIVYSCSWPPYLGSRESAKPFDATVKAGCNLWRNWKDIDWGWESVISTINHWGEWGQVLQADAGPDGPFGGHWNDPDMLL